MLIILRQSTKHANYADMPRIVAFPRWPLLTLRVYMGQKLEYFNFSQNSVKLFEMYSLTYVQRLAKL